MNTETTNNGPAVTGVSVIEYLSNISTVLTGITTNINEQVTRLIAAQSATNLNNHLQRSHMLSFLFLKHLFDFDNLLSHLNYSALLLLSSLLLGTN